MYAAGRGVSKDEAEAAVWIRKAADQGFAAAQGPAANPETLAAVLAFNDCLVVQAKAFDDHTSDAAKIATAVLGACQQPFVQMKVVEARDYQQDMFGGFGEVFDKAAPDDAIQAVLAGRRAQTP
jgi:hypothetical protein